MTVNTSGMQFPPSLNPVITKNCGKEIMILRLMSGIILIVSKNDKQLPARIELQSCCKKAGKVDVGPRQPTQETQLRAFNVRTAWVWIEIKEVD